MDRFFFKYYCAFFTLFILRVLLVFIGFDRLPLIPALGDEVIINDAAITLARTGSMVNQSFTYSSLGLDHLYGHFPPIFILAQAGVIKIFGLSAFSLRLISLTSVLLLPAISSLILLDLYKKKIIKKHILFWITAIIFLDMSSISFGRMARMDSLANFFILLALFKCLGKHFLYKHITYIFFSTKLNSSLTIHAQCQCQSPLQKK